MKLGWVALALVVGGAGLIVLGFAGVIGEGGVELRRHTALGDVMNWVLISGIFAIALGILLGVVALILRLARGPQGGDA